MEQEFEQELKDSLSEYFSQFYNKQKLSQHGQHLKDVAVMMYNININRVGEILANKLPEQEVEELQARALSLLHQYDNNERAWIHFILDLNNKQMNTLAKATMTN